MAENRTAPKPERKSTDSRRVQGAGAVPFSEDEAMASTIYDRPYWVVSKANPTKSGFVHAHKDETEANKDAERRNKKAKQMGLKARYTVIDNPAA